MKPLSSKFYFNYYKKIIDNSIYLLFVLMFIGAIFEIVGISLFLPLLNNNLDNNFSIIIKSIFDTVNIQYTNINIATLIISIFTIKFIVMNIQNYYIYKISYDFMNKVKINIINSIYNMEYISFIKLGNDNLNNIFTKEIEKSSMSIRYFLQLWVNIIYTLMYFTFALYINYIIVIIAFVVGSFIVFLQRRITHSIIHYSKQIVDGNSKTNLIVLQILNNMKYLLSTNTYEYINKKFERISEKYSLDLQRISFLNSIPKLTPEFVGIIVISSIIIINELTVKDNIVTVIFIGLLLYRTLTKFMNIQKSYQDFLINIGAVDKIIEIEDTINVNSSDNKEYINNTFNSIDNIDFCDIKLIFDKKVVLNNISIHLERNNIYAVVGKSGSGKSSLVNILTKLYYLTDGEVFLNNTNLDEYKISEYRNKIGYVSQETVIFEGTLKENIIFDKDYNEERYNELLKNLTLDSLDVDVLNMGGTNISGGQRQLVALARELYKNPGLLILDEFTSALDSMTEKIVMSYIEKYKKDKVIIIVAHRLSSVINTDKVILMDSGELIAQNTFQHLYKHNNKFKLMCNNQNIYF